MLRRSGYARSTSSRRLRSLSGRTSSRPAYEKLEQRNLLATFTVDISIDDGGTTTDGRISLREAVIAANTNAPFGDAPAGDAGNDEIVFAPWLDGKTIKLNGDPIEVTGDLEVRAYDLEITLDANEASTIFDIDTAGQVVFSDLRFISSADVFSTGIEMSGGGTLRLTDSQFSGFGALFEGGSAVRVDGSSLRVLRSGFSNNTSGRGGAIHAVGGDVNVIGSTFTDNYAEANGGAIYFDGGTHLISNSDFIDNLADEPVLGGGSGGAIRIAVESGDATVRIFGGLFENNRSGAGGAISNSGNLTIRNGTDFSSNRALGFYSNSGPVNARGGAVLNTGSLLAVDVSFEMNRSQYGGAIYTWAGPATFNNVSFIENVAAARGGAMEVFGGSVRVINSSVLSNSAFGELSYGYPAGHGGGFHVSDSGNTDAPSVLRFSGTTLRGNNARFHGGGMNVAETSFVFVFGGTSFESNTVAKSYAFPTTIEESGGAVFTSGVFKLNDSTVTSNSSEAYGGGIHVNSGFFSAGNSIISGNSAMYEGGGINIEGGKVRLFQTTVGGSSYEEGNKAGMFTPEGDRGSGGGINIAALAGDASLHMISGVLGFNTAKLNGGGISSSVLGNIVRLENGVSVSSNRALANDGGGIYNNGAHLEVRDSIFAQNTARNGAGLFVENGSTNLSGSTVNLNVARRTGGGMFNRGFLNLVESTIESNEATYFDDLFDSSSNEGN